jgi:hypothetical protein
MAKIETPDPGSAEERFVRIFREHYPSVRAYVGRRAKSELVDDIVAETFLVGWRRLEDVPADAREGCANSVSCGEVVFVDEAAEAVAALDGGGW